MEVIHDAGAPARRRLRPAGDLRVRVARRGDRRLRVRGRRPRGARPAGGRQSGVGSGFVLNGEGEIATNAHVVTTGEVPDLEEAEQVYVEFADGNQVEAEVRGYDPEADVALLKVDPEGLTLRPLPLGEAGKVEVGSPSPRSARRSTSASRSRSASSRPSTARSPGSPPSRSPARSRRTRRSTRATPAARSSTPTARSSASTSRSSRRAGRRGRRLRGADRRRQALPRAAPARPARSSTPTSAWRPWRSTRSCASASTCRSARARGSRASPTTGRPTAAGLRGGDGYQTVFQVRPYRAGGDVITSIDGRPVRDPDDLSLAVAQLDPGRTVTVEAWRDGERQFEVELGERPLSGPAVAG